jgi:hypothetical protein
MKSIIKSGFARRTQVYGILAGLVCLGFAVAMGSLFFGAIGVLSLAIHAVGGK